MWQKKQQAPILSFLGWTFLFAGISYILSIAGEQTGLLSGKSGEWLYKIVDTFVAAPSPLYATYIVLKRHQDVNGFADFWQRVVRTADIKQTVGVTGIFAAALLLPILIAGERTALPWFIVIPAIPLMILGGGLEEIGWRGFLQPALEKKMSYLPAVLTVAIIWFIWHLPLWFINFSNQSSYDRFPYFLQIVVNSFVLSAIYKHSRSTIACVWFHAWSNAIGALYDWRFFATFPINRLLLLYDGLVIIAAIAISLFADRRHLEEE